MSSPAAPFARVVAGVDGTPAGLEAARQAAALTARGGRLVVVAGAETATAAQAGAAALHAASGIEADARAALDAAVAAVAPTEARVVRGAPLAALVGELQAEDATLVAVGGHPRRRATGILLGTVATSLLHDAPCAVLVARGSWPDGVPRRILVGVDGSPASLAALETARGLATHTGAALRAVAASGGKGLADDALAGLPGLERLPGTPLDALLHAAAEADLLVVGSRGLHGVAALGSVSERVAHRAACSTLVVR